MKDTAMTKKPTVKKHELLPLKVKSVEKALKKGDIPTVLVEGDYPTRYNEAAAIVKEAEALMVDLKPILLPDAMSELYRHNSDKPWDPISSVKLQDDAKEVVRVTFVNKYSSTAPVAAEALFADIRTKDGKKPDINNYLTRTLVGSLDSKAFLGSDGKFDKLRYDKISAALTLVCAELGIDNPLSISEAVIPMPDFHGRRWMDFDAATNQRISEVVRNQINFTACPVAAAKIG